MREFGKDKFEIVAPSVSILAEPPVAVVDKVAAKHGTKELAYGLPGVSLHRRRAGDRGEALSTGRGTRRSPQSYAYQFPKIELFTVDKVFGGWDKAQKVHFADGGVFDQIFGAGR